MAKPVSIYNEIENLNYSLLLFGGNLPKTNSMLRRQSERAIDLSTNMLVHCSEALQEDNLNERIRQLRALKTDLKCVDTIVKMWYNLPKRDIAKKFPIVITQNQYAIYGERFSNIAYSVKRWIKATESQMTEDPKKM